MMKYTKKAGICLLALALLIAFVGCAAPTPAPGPGEDVPNTTVAPTAQSNAAVSTVSVSGNSEMKVSPDMATISFGVESKGTATADAALEATNTAIANITAAVQALGAEGKDIQTSSVNLYEEYMYDENGNPTGAPTFTASISLSVTINDVDKVGAYIDAAVKAGATRTNNIRFSLQDPTAFENEALTMAMANAKARADVLAAAAGKTVGEALLVSDGTQMSESVYYDEVVVDPPKSDSYSAGGSYRENISISGGSITITGHVQVRYTMR